MGSPPRRHRWIVWRSQQLADLGYTAPPPDRIGLQFHRLQFLFGRTDLRGFGAACGCGRGDGVPPAGDVARIDGGGARSLVANRSVPERGREPARRCSRSARGDHARARGNGRELASSRSSDATRGVRGSRSTHTRGQAPRAAASVAARGLTWRASGSGSPSTSPARRSARGTPDGPESPSRGDS